MRFIILFLFVFNLYAGCFQTTKIGKSNRMDIRLTEKGSKNEKTLIDIADDIDNNPHWLYSTPIQAYSYNGKIYILDGNTRVSALFAKSKKSDSSLTINIYDKESAIKENNRYKDLIEQIEKKMFDDDIPDLH